jgi:pyrroline-5-carboxylate reductase
MTTVSVIGCGNMGSALIKGLSRSGKYDIIACDLDESALDDVRACSSKATTETAVAADADIIVVAVKPKYVADVLGSLDLSPDQTLVTIAAGITTEFVEARTDATVVRVMPNLAAETGDMAAAVAWDDVDEDVREMLDDVGEFVEIDEELMDAATALNGSGPAFVFYLLQSMKEGAIEEGLSPDQAEVLAAQTFKGAAETVLNDERSVDELIDAVCSPNGTTIEGMEVLWDSDADESVAAALAAATERSKELAENATDE